ncbi:RidA family protein [Roseicyclus sp.]|uniref:RidA family protein n=1 Tax=Roseicyclus sp. TaxID=1914329 RepID=UPI003FA0DF18
MTHPARPEAVNPPHLPDPRPFGYSTAVLAPAAGRLAFISGQGGQDATGGLSPDFAAQVAQACANLGAVLEALGAGPERVVKLTVYVVDHDMAKLPVLTRAVRQMFGDHLPAQTLVGVPRLALDAMLFEVDAVALLD